MEQDSVGCTVAAVITVKCIADRHRGGIPFQLTADADAL